MKSLFAGYFRGWVGLFAMISLTISAVNAVNVVYHGQPKDTLGLVLRGLLVLLATAGTIWTIAATHASWWISYGLIVLVTVAYLVWDAQTPPFHDPAAAPAGMANPGVGKPGVANPGVGPAAPGAPRGNNPQGIAPPPLFVRQREGLPNFLAVGHAALFAVTLLRTFDRGSRRRAYEYGELLGLDDHTVATIIGPPSDDQPSHAFEEWDAPGEPDTSETSRSR